ncbi:cyclopropane-fatty-acyl-phospholipid synthase [Erythrobacter litoralis]|uniref:SAM-dependent methyltransferase n=1 Tax=Erythrobacter litoralis TaxID=39960 RepID=UPI0005591F4B|nr:cyclopropane-fatty-acyl-phospholipid synthase family protein [Erythrobacter litoralis]AOL23360.1 cyclopropane-fatty-acyl-phospholipid synthase [Erythrobacter litoralis]
MKAGEIRGERLLAGGARFAPSPSLLASPLFARLLAPAFRTILDRIDAGLRAGSLRAYLPDGTTRLLGGHAPGFEVEVRLKDWRALVRLATQGSIGWYRAYEAGEWEASDMVALFALFSANARSLGDTARSSGPFRLLAMAAHRLNRNSRAGAARNISAHYDIGNDFYAAWLDPGMTYSSALDVDEESGADSLVEAQARKMDAIAARLGKPARVLEIGCGWGGLAHRLAAGGVAVTAISLSREQLDWAQACRDDAIDFRLQDYRDVTGQYDAIVSVEMVEALGREYWSEFLDCIARCLRPGGRAAIQFISMADDLFETYAQSADFIQAYVFPGGLLIKRSEFRRLAAERGLAWHDQADFGQDYARTLKAWLKRFDAAVAENRLPSGFDDRFVRLWRYYLAYCEGGFRAGTIDVHQVTLIGE